MFTTTTAFLKRSLLVLIALLMVSCGNDDEAPGDGQIVLSLDGLDISDSAYIFANFGDTCDNVYPPQTWDIVPMRVSVLNLFNQVLPGVTIFARMMWSSATTNGAEIVWLFDDRNGDGTVVDNNGTPTNSADDFLDITELVSGPGTSISYETQTNGQGYKDLYLVMDAACAFTGTFSVTSGVLAESLDIDKG